MKVLVESHIPYIKGLIEPYAEVQYLEPEQFTAQSVSQADALIIRTRTRCNNTLLDGSRCQFIGTATIGTDHIDLAYCRNRGITVCNAPGCNAPAVAQYVLSTVARHISATGEALPQKLTLGVVGVGHVGSIVARFAKECGFRVLLCDPPRALNEGPQQFVSLQQIAAEANIITFHTPLTTNGEHPTHHICNEQFLNQLKHCSLLINSARGPVFDTEALVRHLRINPRLQVAIDCWEGEPNINAELLQRAFVATPHIAGYSAEGKTRGTAMVIDQLNAHFGWHIQPKAVDPKTPTAGAANVTLQRIAESYNPLVDTQRLRTAPSDFEAQRNHYDLRHEVESANL
ncbi:MAG: 4-phosphoerythronate dehydrogenase [Muribaculaceae bacterium]